MKLRINKADIKRLSDAQRERFTTWSKIRDSIVDRAWIDKEGNRYPLLDVGQVFFFIMDLDPKGVASISTYTNEDGPMFAVQYKNMEFNCDELINCLWLVAEEILKNGE